MKEFNPIKISLKVFDEISKNDFLLTLGKLPLHNSMTVGWASLGYLWQKTMAFVYVRPQRYTYQFMEENVSRKKYSNYLKIKPSIIKKPKIFKTI